MMTLNIEIDSLSVYELWRIVWENKARVADLIAWNLSEGRKEHALHFVPEWQTYEQLADIIIAAEREAAKSQ